MTILKSIFEAHINNELSLASIVQNTFTAYILISSLYYIIFKYLLKGSSKNPAVKVFKTYFVAYMKDDSFIIDTLLLGLIVSVSFMIFRIVKAELDNRTTKDGKQIKPMNTSLLFFLIFNGVIILVLSLIVSLSNKFKNYKPLGSWIKLLSSGGFIFYYMLMFNLIVLVAALIMYFGYSNIIIPPIYAALVIKHLFAF